MNGPTGRSYRTKRLDRRLESPTIGSDMATPDPRASSLTLAAGAAGAGGVASAVGVGVAAGGGGEVLRVTEADVAANADHPAVLRAVDTLVAGELVVLPTETVYGVASITRLPAALKRLATLRPDIRTGKNGGPPQPLTIHVASLQAALAYIDEPGPWQARAMRLLWGRGGVQTGAPIGLRLTVSAARQKEVAGRLGLDPSLIYTDEGITMRCPAHAVARAVLAGVDARMGAAPGQGAVVLIQAGTPGGHPALRADDIGGDVAAAAKIILDAGATRFSRPSTLVRLGTAGGGTGAAGGVGGVGGRGWSVVREGVYDQRSIERMLKHNLIFVCSGNTCRSPMAAAIARDILARELQIEPDELEAAGLNVISAGTMAANGMPASRQGVLALDEMGIDLSGHRSRQLERGLVDTADLIVVMAQNHQRLILDVQPSARDRVKTLDPDGDIEDPIGSDTAVYKALAERMVPLVRRHLTDAGLIGMQQPKTGQG